MRDLLCFNPLHFLNSTGDESYTTSGSIYHLGFFNNLRFTSLLSQANLRVQVTSDDSETANVRVSYQDTEVVREVPPGEATSVDVDSQLRLNNIGERDKAVVVESLNGQRISVVGLSEEVTSSDTFCVLPLVFLPTSYEYYAISVPKTEIQSVSEGEVEDITPEEKSAFLIVSTDDGTQISLTLTQSVSTDDADDLSQFGPMINRGETVSLTLDRDKTLYVSSVDDLTGSRVTSNKPITFFSGHECGTIPQTLQYCDQMIEQIPPTATWGREFFTAPFLTRTEGDAFVVLASDSDTVFSGVCYNRTQDTLTEVGEFIIPSAGETVNFTVSSFQVCRFLSNKPVLLAQFSLASSTDNNSNADPFMVVIPSVEQYRDSLSFKVFETLTELHFINIFLPVAFDPSGLRFNGDPLPEDAFLPIACNSSRETCGFAAQVPITTDMQTVTHVDPNARLAVIVYSLGFRTGQGFSAGMALRPITRM